MSHPNTTLGGGRGFADKDQLEQVARLVGNVNSQDERMIGIDYSAHGIGIKYRGTPFYITFNPGTEDDGSGSLPGNFTVDYIFRVAVKPPGAFATPLVLPETERSHGTLLEGTFSFRTQTFTSYRIDIYISSMTELYDPARLPFSGGPFKSVIGDVKVLWAAPNHIPNVATSFAIDDVTAVAEVGTGVTAGGGTSSIHKRSSPGEIHVATINFNPDGTWEIPQPDVDGLFEIIPWEYTLDYGASAPMVFMYEEETRRFHVKNFHSAGTDRPRPSDDFYVVLPETGVGVNVFFGKIDPSKGAIPGSVGTSNGLALGLDPSFFIWSWNLVTVNLDVDRHLVGFQHMATTFVPVNGMTTSFTLAGKVYTFSGGSLVSVEDE